MKDKILIVTDNFVMYQKIRTILFSKFTNALELFDFRHSKLSKMHVMDKEIDHGPIIDRKKVLIESSDTSKEAFEKVLETELELFEKNIESIVNQTYSLLVPEGEGAYHSIDDFRKICHLDLDEKVTLGDAIDKLIALSHGAYKNAYFIDKNGNKIYVSIDLTKDCN